MVVSRRYWALLTGYAAWAKVMTLCMGLELVQEMREWTPNDSRLLNRTFWSVLIATTACTTLLLKSEWYPPEADAAVLTRLIYLLPSMLTQTFPAGLTLGITMSLSGRAISRRFIITLVVIAFGSSVASFVNVDRIVPVANQAFREAVIGRSIPKGHRELTLKELRERLESAERAPVSTQDEIRLRIERTDYYSRWAVNGLPDGTGCARWLVVAIAAADQPRAGKADDGQDHHQSDQSFHPLHRGVSYTPIVAPAWRFLPGVPREFTSHGLYCPECDSPSFC